MFARVSTLWSHGVPFNSFGNVGTPSGDGPNEGGAQSVMMDQVYAFSPNLLLNARYGFGRRVTNRRPFSAGFDITTLGFPESVKRAAELQALEFPRFNVGNGVSSLGQNTFTDLVITPMNHSFNVNITKITSPHTLKFGMDYRKLLLNFLQLGQPSGQYDFSEGWTQQNPFAGSDTAGFGMASLLLGIPGGGQISHDPTPASASSYWAFYIQDDWKVTPRLTLNLGLRYDLDVPRTERFDRLSIFRLDAPSPIAGKAPGFPNLRGAMDFVNEKNRRQVATEKTNFGPRFGFAYRLEQRMVVRGGYGIYYSASAFQAAGHTGSAGMQGFRTSTPFISSLDGGRTPINFLRNPFPDGFNFPTGNSLGASTDLGLGLGESVFLGNAVPYIQQWNLNLERELPGDLLFEAAYLGSKGTHLIDGEAGVVLNQLAPQFYDLRTKLRDLVDNPFLGVITNPASSLSKPKVTRGQLLRPFPHYTSVAAFRKPAASSIYHALTLRADKRFSHGLSFLVSYTAGKLIDDTSQTVSFLGPAGNKQDAYNRRAERSVSTQDVAQRLVISYVYDLPFGRQRRFLSAGNSLAERLVSGWQFNGIATFQSGTPLIITGPNEAGFFSPGQRPNWNGQSARIEGGSTADRIAKWFDTSVFSRAGEFTFGTTPRTMPDARTPGQRNFDLSLFKNNSFGEGKYTAQFRVELFNAFNTPQFGAPGQSSTAGNFGVIGGTAIGPRQIQLALKLIF